MVIEFLHSQAQKKSRSASDFRGTVHHYQLIIASSLLHVLQDVEFLGRRSPLAYFLSLSKLYRVNCCLRGIASDPGVKFSGQ